MLRYGPYSALTSALLARTAGPSGPEAGRAADLRVTLAEHDAAQEQGSAHWLADYTFRTGRKVHNDIRARFRFEDGLIAEHHDSFSFYAWARQALGPVGLALGWTPMLRAKVQREARMGLDEFLAQS